MSATLKPESVETIGNGSATDFQGVTKADAVRCLAAAIESFIAGRGLSRAQLSEDICGMSPGYFSKVINGEQGDFFGLVYGKLPGEIRQDFIERLAALERFDPVVMAMEQMIAAAFRVIQTTRRQLPARAIHMAHAGVEQERKRA